MTLNVLQYQEDAVLKSANKALTTYQSKLQNEMYNLCTIKFVSYEIRLQQIHGHCTCIFESRFQY